MKHTPIAFIFLGLAIIGLLFWISEKVYAQALVWDITYCNESICYDAYKSGRDRYIVETTDAKTDVVSKYFIPDSKLIVSAILEEKPLLIASTTNEKI